MASALAVEDRQDYCNKVKVRPVRSEAGRLRRRRPLQYSLGRADGPPRDLRRIVSGQQRPPVVLLPHGRRGGGRVQPGDPARSARDAARSPRTRWRARGRAVRTRARTRRSAANCSPIPRKSRSMPCRFCSRRRRSARSVSENTVRVHDFIGGQAVPLRAAPLVASSPGTLLPDRTLWDALPGALPGRHGVRHPQGPGPALDR